MDRFFDYYVLSALACFLCLAAGRAIILHLRGVRIIGHQREQSLGERLEDIAGVACPAIRAYETLAFAVPLAFHPEPPIFGKILLSALPWKIAGALLWAMALALYALALRAFGSSWRLRVESDSPGGLITHGIFQWSRNPIYLSFMLMNLGTLLILGQLIFALIAMVAIPLLYRRIVREEKFLAATYGDAYQEYCSRVSRYLKLF